VVEEQQQAGQRQQAGSISGDLGSISDDLAVIVAGRTHSGTTQLSLFLEASTEAYGGFEGGPLLAPSPAQFERVTPWHEGML